MTVASTVTSLADTSDRLSLMISGVLKLACDPSDTIGHIDGVNICDVALQLGIILAQRA